MLATALEWVEAEGRVAASIWQREHWQVEALLPQMEEMELILLVAAEVGA
jgi:hypothetical protein